MILRLRPGAFRTAGAAPQEEVPVLAYRAPQIAYMGQNEVISTSVLRPVNHSMSLGSLAHANGISE